MANELAPKIWRTFQMIITLLKYKLFFFFNYLLAVLVFIAAQAFLELQQAGTTL